jgi:hypothetical protein
LVLVSSFFMASWTDSLKVGYIKKESVISSPRARLRYSSSLMAFQRLMFSSRDSLGMYLLWYTEARITTVLGGIASSGFPSSMAFS